MRALLAVEWFKLWRQRRTYYALGALLAIEAMVMGSAYLQGAEIIYLALAGLRDTFYFEGNLLNGNLVTYFLLNSLWFHVPLILIIIVSGLLTTEYKDNTIQTVFMQPVGRWQYILSKYVVGIGFTLLIVTSLAISSFLFAYLLFGKGDLIVYLNGLVFYEQESAFWRLVGAFVAGAGITVFYSVVSLTLAVWVRESVTTWILSLLFLILANVLMKVDFNSELVHQLFFPKLNDTWQYFFISDIPYPRIAANLAVLAVYSIAAMGLGVYRFQKKELG